jgi:two-component system sensor histidine kinase VicK
VAFDALELQLASALQRFSTLQRRAESPRDPSNLLTKTLAELGTALEEVRVAQEQLIESRARMEQMQAELRRQHDKYWQLFDEMPEAYVVSRPDTTILEVNKAAAQFFNVSQRFLIGKTLSVFVCEERTQFLDASARVAAEGTPLDLSLKIRPRERAPMPVSVRVSGSPNELRWILHTAGLYRSDPL